MVLLPEAHDSPYSSTDHMIQDFPNFTQESNGRSNKVCLFHLICLFLIISNCGHQQWELREASTDDTKSRAPNFEISFYDHGHVGKNHQFTGFRISTYELRAIIFKWFLQKRSLRLNEFPHEYLAVFTLLDLAYFQKNQFR